MTDLCFTMNGNGGLAAERQSCLGEIPSALSTFREVSPELLSDRSLQQRVDRKYLLPKRLLDPFLALLSSEYRLLRSGGRMAARYHTQYFDTPEWQMYEDHRRGRRPRYKVRVRHHLDRGLSFLEIKCKVSNYRTIKTRLERPFGNSELDAAALAFIERNSSVRAALIVPRVWIAFRRITLVGEHVNERVTLDCDVEIFHDGHKALWPNVVFAEVKQGHFSNITPAVGVFRKLRVSERAVSKYCLATAKLAPVRSNIFKSALRAVEQLSV